MRLLNLAISLLLSGLILFSCRKSDDNTVNHYDEYLKIELSSINNSNSDSVFTITIINTNDRIFEQKCVLQYSLINKQTNIEYFASEDIINKRIPNQPTNDVFNLQGGGNYNYLVKLNNVKWDNVNLINKGDYTFRVTLFIKDMNTPYNCVYSNSLQLKK